MKLAILGQSPRKLYSANSNMEPRETFHSNTNVNRNIMLNFFTVNSKTSVFQKYQQICYLKKKFGLDLQILQGTFALGENSNFLVLLLKKI